MLALREGVPALAVDPVRGGGKVSVQADAVGWPAVIGAEGVHRDGALDHWWRWCFSPGGRSAAAEYRTRTAENALEPLVDVLAEGQLV